MKRLGLGVSNVDRTITFHFVVKGHSEHFEPELERENFEPELNPILQLVPEIGHVTPNIRV